MSLITATVILTATVCVAPGDAAAMNATLDVEALRLTAVHGLPAGLLQAMMGIESNGHPWAVGTSGEFGPLQTIPSTAWAIADLAGLDADLILCDPVTNLQAGAWFIASLLARFRGAIPEALAAYNGGLAAVIDCGGPGIQCVPEGLVGYVRAVYWRWNKPYLWQPPPAPTPEPVPPVTFLMICYSPNDCFGTFPELADLPAGLQCRPLVNVEGHGSQEDF